MNKAGKGLIFVSGALFGIAYMIACGTNANDIVNAIDVLFDKTGTSLSAENVQDAIEQLDSTVTNLGSSTPTISLRTASDTDGTVTVACNTGEVLTGGGCDCGASSAIRISVGDTSQQWTCECDTPTNVTANAFCLSQ